MIKKRLGQILKQFSVGMRIIKTVISIYLSIVISLAINGQPTSAAIAAFICTRSSNKDSVDTGKTRAIGTLIGALFSLVFIIIIKYFNVELFTHGYYIMLSLLLIPIIKVTIWLKIPGATVSACIVVLITLLSYVKDGDPHVRIIYRFVDTIIGVIVAIIVNKVLSFEKDEKEGEKEKPDKDKGAIKESADTNEL
ncbi:MAG: hypothetical protein GX222_04365 [Ruminococcaceae bacterium]|nr:hypothetical protein [Oscillospiraceae bacterium]